MDSDSDNEDFVSFGTPLEIIQEDEPLPKPISVQDQIVRDQQGRQRFHGAFTGGFSAGFFNTVGSKEGFTPSTFVSSRAKRADQHEHRPEDFMDEDDKGEYGIAPRKLVTTQRFAGEEVGPKKRPAADSNIIPDDGRIQDIIKPTDETIGARLLRRMGWKPGQGVGPKMERMKKSKRKKNKGGGRVYGCSRPPVLGQQSDDDSDADDNKEGDDDGPVEDSDEEDFMRGFLFAPDDIQDFIFALKDDQHGIGYQGMDSRSVLGGHVTLFDEPVMKQNRRQGIKGRAFGIGAFEDEEESDVYSTDRMSNYDRVLGGEEEKTERRMFGWTGPPPRHSSDVDILDGFEAASQGKISTKVFHPPSLPRDFRPFHQFNTPTVETPNPPKTQAHSRFTLSADQRAAMLGEERLPGPSSVDELLSSQDLALLKEARDKASSLEQDAPRHRTQLDRGASRWSAPTQEATSQATGSGFQPFAKDEEKQQRYELYLQNRHQGSQTATGDTRTEWEKQQEIEEFSRAASLYHKPMSGLMASRFVRAKHSDDVDDTVEVPADLGGDANDQCKAAEMKMFGQLTRDTMEWHPDKLLCKRFNVADPYPESSIVGLPTVKKDKYSVFNFLEIQQSTSAQMDIYPTQPELPQVASKDVVEEPSRGASEKKSRWDQHPGILANVGSKKEIQDDENQQKSKIIEYEVPIQDSTGEGDDKPRLPLDLFQAIFLDSDTSSSSSEEDHDSDGEGDRKKPDGPPLAELQTAQGKTVLCMIMRFKRRFCGSF
ncbi:G patch domain-containing protein 1-like [Lytechinus pictus]|uniref:G patch domain-containing protein 1-like n=1 Tax=Lytechinus pictus TaxID=7653 RepID=UPI0030B9FD0B